MGAGQYGAPYVEIVQLSERIRHFKLTSAAKLDLGGN